MINFPQRSWTDYGGEVNRMDPGSEDRGVVPLTTTQSTAR